MGLLKVRNIYASSINYIECICLTGNDLNAGLGTERFVNLVNQISNSISHESIAPRVPDVKQYFTTQWIT